MVKWFKKRIRRLFCNNEVRAGHVLVIWRDVDKKVTGWCCSADHEEEALRKIGEEIAIKKRLKLEQMVGEIKIKEGDGI